MAVYTLYSVKKGEYYIPDVVPYYTAYLGAGGAHTVVPYYRRVSGRAQAIPSAGLLHIMVQYCIPQPSALSWAHSRQGVCLRKPKGCLRLQAIA